MTCDQFSDVVADLVDGRLDPATERAAERHAEGCEACRSLRADLKTIGAAAFTLDRIEPPARVWDRIQERLHNERITPAAPRLLAWPRTRTAWGLWGAAAAALLVATLVGLLPLLQRRDDTEQITQQQGEGQDLVESVQADLEAAEAHYEKAIQGLEVIARSDSDALDPQVAAVFQKNLQVIDQAIGESRAALKTQPASTDVQEGLFDAMRTKVALLQQTVELINEMRKGNQAEAGRIIQGLK
jgi:anti-sigma factor RsiW